VRRRTTIVGRALGAAVLAAALAGAPPAAADILLFQRETGPAPDGGSERITEKEIAISNDKMRIRDATTGDQVIVRLDMRVVWEFPPESKEYIEIPFSYLEKMKDMDGMTDEEILSTQMDLADPSERARLKTEIEDTRRQRARESAETRAQRETMEAERRRIAGRKPAVRWTGKTERIAGFSAREAHLIVDSTKVAEVWVTKDAFFEKDLAGYVEAMRSLSLAGGGAGSDLEELGGFPLKTVLYPVGGGAAKPLVLEIIEARREAFAPWEFDLPPGVRRAPFLPPTDTE
jgi:hypothetical protein